MAPYISESMKRRALLDKELYPIEFKSFKTQKAKKRKHIVKDKQNYLVSHLLENRVDTHKIEEIATTIYFKKIKASFIVKFLNVKENIIISKTLNLVGWMIKYDDKEHSDAYFPYIYKNNGVSFYKNLKSAKAHFQKTYDIGSKYLFDEIEKVKMEFPVEKSFGYIVSSVSKNHDHKSEVLETINYTFMENKYVGYEFKSDKKYQKHFYGTNLEFENGSITNHKDIYLKNSAIWHKKRRKKNKVYNETSKYNKIMALEKDFSWNKVNYSKENWRAELALNMLV